MYVIPDTTLSSDRLSHEYPLMFRDCLRTQAPREAPGPRPGCSFGSGADDPSACHGHDREDVLGMAVSHRPRLRGERSSKSAMRTSCPRAWTCRSSKHAVSSRAENSAGDLRPSEESTFMTITDPGTSTNIWLTCATCPSEQLRGLYLNAHSRIIQGRSDLDRDCQQQHTPCPRISPTACDRMQCRGPGACP